MTTTHKLVHPDGSPYLSESDKQFEEISKKVDDMIFRIRNINDQLDICVIRVSQVEERIDQLKNWMKRNDH